MHAPGHDPQRGRSPDALAGCPVFDLKLKLRKAGLRPTRQRLALGWMLFGRGDRHVSAETLFEEAQSVRFGVSLATIYNTLNQFTRAGLLREVAIEGNRSYFDTNPSDHQHFLIEGEEGLIDIPDGAGLHLGALPELPEGTELVRVEVVVRLKRRA